MVRTGAAMRKRTHESILQALELNNASDAHYIDQVDIYMSYYDSLKLIDTELKRGFNLKLSNEKRQITKEMRNILLFLGLKPEITGGCAYEEL